jgi:hypothetical protein
MPWQSLHSNERMQMKRLLVGIFLVAVLLTPACSNPVVSGTPVADSVGAPQSITPKVMNEVIDVYPATELVGEIEPVASSGNMTLRCKPGLKAREVGTESIVPDPADQLGVTVSVLTYNGDPTTQVIRYTPNSSFPQVKGMFVIAANLIMPDFGKFYPVAWLPGMERSFSVRSDHFDQRPISGVVLCI